MNIPHPSDRESSSKLLECLRLLLRPLMAFCLRHSIKMQELLECTKAVFLEVALNEMQKKSTPASTSRLSAMTGIHRRDVARLSARKFKIEKPDNLISRVIGQWQQDERFSTKEGKPKILSVDSGEFAELVASVSKDLNPYTVLFELERISAVSRTQRGIKLEARIFLPKGDIVEGFKLLSRDANDLITSVEENVFREGHEMPHLHLKTEYDNVTPEALSEIKAWMITEGSALHQKARIFISKFDRDINPKISSKTGRIRVALATFSKVEDLETNLKKKRG